jgi:hypothetical protein
LDIRLQTVTYEKRTPVGREGLAYGFPSAQW